MYGSKVCWSAAHSPQLPELALTLACRSTDGCLSAHPMLLLGSWLEEVCSSTDAAVGVRYVSGSRWNPRCKVPILGFGCPFSDD